MNLFTDKKRPHLIFSLLFVAFFFVNLFYRLKYSYTTRLWPDEALYAWLSHKIDLDPKFIFSAQANEFHPALFPLLLTAGKIFAPGLAGYRAIVLIINLLQIVFVYILGKKAFNPFVGLIASFFLSSNFLFFAHSNLILADGLLTLSIIILCILLLNLHEKPNLINNLLIAGWLGGIILIKWNAFALTVPLLTIYYLTVLNQIPLRERLTHLLIPLAVTGIVVFPIAASMLNSIHNVIGGYITELPWYFYLVKLPYYIQYPPIILCFIFGLYCLFKNIDAPKKLLLIWLLTFLTVTSIPLEKDGRYLLPMYPCIFLIAALGLEGMINLFFKEKVTLKIQLMASILILAICFTSVINSTRVLNRINHNYWGFASAAKRINILMPNEGTLIAGSDRAIRYHSKIEFKKWGGALYNIPPTQKEFESFIETAQRPIVIETDIWEYIQPSWIYPFKEEQFDYLESLGFKLDATVKTDSEIGIWIWIKP